MFAKAFVVICLLQITVYVQLRSAYCKQYY